MKAKAFTLLEILIVVIILGVLAGIVIPSLGNSSDDARLSAVKSNLQTVRSQLQVYRFQHNNTWPATMTLMTQSTNDTGATGAAGSSYPLGPYFTDMPVNPFTNSNTVKVVASATDSNPKDGTTGWYYNPTTGTIKANSNNTVNSTAVGDL